LEGQAPECWAPEDLALKWSESAAATVPCRGRGFSTPYILWGSQLRYILWGFQSFLVRVAKGKGTELRYFGGKHLR